MNVVRDKWIVKINSKEELLLVKLILAHHKRLEHLPNTFINPFYAYNGFFYVGEMDMLEKRENTDYQLICMKMFLKQ